MLTENTKATLGLILRVIIGGLLFYAGLSKALEPVVIFGRAIHSYHAVPDRMIGLVAFFLPWIEMIVGTYLIVGFWTRLSAGAAGALFAVYIGVVLVTLARSIPMGSCVCFGTGLALSPHQTILLDAILLVASVVLFRVSPSTQKLALDAWIEKS